MKATLDRNSVDLLFTIMPGPRELKAIRKRLGLSQKDLAAKAGVATMTVSRIESNHSTCGANYETAHRLARALGCNVKDIAWPRGLSGNGCPPGQKGPQKNPIQQRVICTECFTVHSLSWKPGDACEMYG